MIASKKVVATIEGRMTSTRLPGKIMMPLAGKPVMAHMIERHRRSRYTDEVVVATTVNAADDPVVALCERMRCQYFRGSEADVLGRIVEAGIAHKADILIQGMADSPLVDWRFLRLVPISLPLIAVLCRRFRRYEIVQARVQRSLSVSSD